ncbi:hypothetical protein DFJ43DRAFT_1041500 [Lentinula guzmanii]|uniref:Uncharacterized protein n=1 Tax=Lentinula guzmanii TaxID=2804957 RepID=A0AA38JDI9_9AGAR|nr:hypothetical protein DFJ43DRAFT_1041500 [Lentinula guzmanii]
MPNTRAQTKRQTRSNGLTDAVTLSTVNMPGKRTRKKQTTVAGPSETHTCPPRRTKKTVTKKVNATPAPESSASRAAQRHSPAPMEHSPGTIPSPAHPSASSPTQPRSSPPIQHPPTTRSLSPACPPVASPPPPNSPAPSLPPPSSNPPVSTPEDWEEEDDGLTAAILSNDIQTRSPLAGPDDIPTVLPPLRTYLHGVDEEGYYGIVFHTAYLLRELSANLLPEMCYWYLERFSEDTSLSFFINRTITEFKVADLFGDDLKEVEPVEREAEGVESKVQDTVQGETENGDEMKITQKNVVEVTNLFDDDHNVQYVTRGRRLAANVNYDSSPAPSEEYNPPHTSGEEDRPGEEDVYQHDADGGLFSDAEDDDQGGQMGPHQGNGPLPEALRKKLDAINAERDAQIEQAAVEAGKSIQSCYKYANGNLRVTRSASIWNIWQAWYGVHGEKKRPSNVKINEWTSVVRDEMNEFLHSKLSDEEFSDPAARENALQEQADWFWARFDSFVEDSKGKGKRGDAMTRRILEPIIRMSNRVYQETGFHIGGYIYHSEIGASIWVGTKALQRVKATNGTQMLTQARHIGTKIAHVDAELAALHGHCCVKSNARQRNRHILPMIFAYDAKRIFEKDSDVNKLQPTTFIDNAWRAKVRIVNWPPGVPFYKQGVTTKKGFVAGVQKVTDFRAPDLAKICDPRIAQIEREVKKEEDSENMPLPYFEMVPWNDDEKKLPLHQQGKLSLVSDTSGAIVAAVSHVEAYHTLLAEERRNHRAVSIPASDLSSGVPLYEEDEEDEDVSLPTTQPSAAPPVPLATRPIQTLSAALRRRPPPIPMLSDQRAQLVRRRDSDVDERVEPPLKKARTLS